MTEKQETQVVEDVQEETETPTTGVELTKEELMERIMESVPPIFKKVDSIMFGIFSPQMVKKMSSAKIVTPELYDKEGYPVDGGLMDIRLGVIDPGLKCKTCGSKLKECTGHFGYIELARPLVHIDYVRFILSILRGTCKECGKIMIPEDKAKALIKRLDDSEENVGILARKKTVDNIKKLLYQKKCPHCKTKQGKITIEKPTTFLEDERKITPIEIRARLEKISDEDCALFGLNPNFVRPEWLILTILPIPPVTMRPSITLESGERSEDDLTHKLGDIVRINQRLFENINAGAPEVIIEDLWDLLQYHVTTFFDNEVAQLPPARHRSGQPLKTIAGRIKSKEGRIRSNLAGKRTNYSARTVISPDPCLAINEVGVPQVIAMNITVPEKVTEWNIEYLKKFVQNGPKKYPGSNYVSRPDGRRRKITDETKEQSLEELQPGYIVERHVMDGDVALFNRQPSLHKMSMMCHKVRVLPYKTLRMNPAVCNPYNADFDGDEMNLHIPQTEEARAEAELLMMVQTQLISPRYGLSIIGCKQDAITGNYLLTNESFKIDRNKAIDILFSIGLTEFDKLGTKKQVTGQELFSCILPDDFTFTGKTKRGEPVIIKKGILEKGQIDKLSVGEEAGLLFKQLHQKYGSERTVEIMYRIFTLGIKILLAKGFTVSIKDTDLQVDIKNKITKILTDADNEVKSLIKQFEDETIETFPGKTQAETLELRIMETLNKARNECGKAVSERESTSGTLTMMKSGARGNPINLYQMAACVGQQALRGKRINIGYNGRTLPFFKKHDLGTQAHGFVSSSFKSGMNPNEFYFQAIVGRDSLMDTALRTPKSGYLYRRLANALQDIKMEYDYTVRDANGKIIQFKYGEDGIDVSKSEGGKLNVQRIIK